jgi:hypothetical protein
MGRLLKADVQLVHVCKRYALVGRQPVVGTNYLPLQIQLNKVQ